MCLLRDSVSSSVKMGRRAGTEGLCGADRGHGELTRSLIPRSGFCSVGSALVSPSSSPPCGVRLPSPRCSKRRLTGGMDGAGADRSLCPLGAISKPRLVCVYVLPHPLCGQRKLEDISSLGGLQTLLFSSRQTRPGTQHPKLASQGGPGCRQGRRAPLPLRTRMLSAGCKAPVLFMSSFTNWSLWGPGGQCTAWLGVLGPGWNPAFSTASCLRVAAFKSASAVPLVGIAGAGSIEVNGGGSGRSQTDCPGSNPALTTYEPCAWVGCFVSLCLSFHIPEMGIIGATSLGGCEGHVRGDMCKILPLEAST